jgi:hypothetical protein
VGSAVSQEEVAMHDLVSKMSHEDIIPIAVVGIMFGVAGLVALVSMITKCVYKVSQLSVSARMKQDMLERGMSADEIKTVLEAGPQK